MIMAAGFEQFRFASLPRKHGPNRTRRTRRHAPSRQLNVCSYVEADPINFTDPLGLTPAVEGLSEGVIINCIGWDFCPSTWVVTGNRALAPWFSFWEGIRINPFEFGGGGAGGGRGGGGGGGGGGDKAQDERSKGVCPTDRNIVAAIDAGIFLGYGFGFTLGANYDAASGAVTLFASAREGTGAGWIAGAGVGLSNTAPSSGISSSRNVAIGFGSYGGTVSTSSGKTRP